MRFWVGFKIFCFKMRLWHVKGFRERKFRVKGYFLGLAVEDFLGMEEGT